MLRRLKASSGGLLMLLAIVLGGATAAVTMLWLNQQSEQPGPGDGADEVQLVEVIVASADIPPGATIDAAMLSVAELPADAVPAGVLDDSEAVVGRVARYPLLAMEPVTTSKLVGADGATAETLAFTVPRGMRAVSVPFSEVMGAGGLVLPGDHVDVLVSTEYARLFEPAQVLSEDEDSDAPVVLTVLQDVLVLAVGQEFTPMPAGASGEGTERENYRAAGAEAQPGARSVTFAVSPDEAQRLFLATQQGVLGLSLRPFGDDGAPAVSPVFKLESSQTSASVNAR